MKKSFTLVEILISIGILSVLLLAMSNVISGLKISKTTLKSAYESSSKEELFIKTLYGDIINAKEIKIQHSRNNKNYNILFLRTKNSLYKNIYPYVIWYVSKNGNAIVRAENHEKITFEKENYFIDVFKKGIKKFKIYKKDLKYFVYIEGRKPLFFELYKGW